MDFTDFLNVVPKIANLALPGEIAHFKMVPPGRKQAMQDDIHKSVGVKMAAVMMLIYPKNNQSHLALIKRANYKGVHASQIAFPGGKVEHYDDSLQSAALRETEEEIGVSATELTLVCPFSDIYIPPSNFRVFPFLGFCHHTPLFLPDAREVAAMLEYPVAALLDDQLVTVNKIATSYAELVDVPAFQLGENIIWGATAMMLSELKDVLKTVL